MLPRELADKAKAVEKALEDFKDATIAWMNANDTLHGSSEAK